MAAHLLARVATDPGQAPRHVVVPLDAAGNPAGPAQETSDLPDAVARVQAQDPAARWVWEDTRALYPALLAAGVEVTRCHDLGLAARILTGAVPASGPTLLPPRASPGPLPDGPVAESLFDAAPAPPAPERLGAEYARQLSSLPPGQDGARLRLLMALDSAGALLAAEMSADGLPWDRATHEALLLEELGPRVPHGTRPARLADLTEVLQDLLDTPRLNPDSQPEVLAALRRAGLEVSSTSKWVLSELEHPAIAPLLRYKQLSRLLSSTGWAWLDTWVHGNRFHPEYVVAGVVTGRWAGHGGGAQQIPHQIRSAVRADPGHVLIVADAAQLEPRVLAAISQDTALATAARGRDLYQAIASAAFDGDRSLAKVAMLGAMYGGSTGPSAAVAPRLASIYPRATAFLETAARAGERGESVRTFLGRTSPRAAGADAAWAGAVSGPEGGVPDDEGAGGQGASRAAARAYGRFTRNFVVQGSAAEWAECWMATLRTHLRRVAPGSRQVFFLHDEIMVHARLEEADAVEDAMHAAATEASQLLFGRIPVDFPVSVGRGEDYASAKT